MYAIFHGHREGVDLLLEAGADPNAEVRPPLSLSLSLSHYLLTLALLLSSPQTNDQ